MINIIKYFMLIFFFKQKTAYEMRISDWSSDVCSSDLSAIELHHLFPRGYLEDSGVTDNKKINQIANFALVEWPDTLKIGKKSPAHYAPGLEIGISHANSEKMYFRHALPPLWWTLG